MATGHVGARVPDTRRAAEAGSKTRGRTAVHVAPSDGIILGVVDPVRCRASLYESKNHLTSAVVRNPRAFRGCYVGRRTEVGTAARLHLADDACWVISHAPFLARRV